MRSTSLAVTGLVGVGAAVSVVCKAALAWDGSYFFFLLMNARQPQVAHGRYSTALFQLVLLAAAEVTSDMTVLRFVYCAVFAVVPVVALGSSWLVVRRQAPDLFVWAVFGIGFACLPGQMFQISESIIVCQLGWPLVLAAAVGLRGRWALANAALLTPLLFFAHLSSAAILAGAGAAAAVAAIRLPERRRLLVPASAVWIAFGVIRYLLVHDEYERANLDAAAIVKLYPPGLAGWPIRALVLGFVAAALLGMIRWVSLRGRARQVAGIAVVSLLALAAAALFRWASLPSAWRGALDFRVFAQMVSLPFFSLLVIDVLVVPSQRAASAAGDGPWRERAALGVALTFCVVLSLLSGGWSTLLASLSARVQAAPSACVAPADLAAEGTALEHWATPTLVLAMQGRQPTKAVLDERDCRVLARESAIRLNPFDVRPIDQDGRAAGWYDFGPLRSAAEDSTPQRADSKDRDEDHR